MTLPSASLLDVTLPSVSFPEPTLSSANLSVDTLPSAILADVTLPAANLSTDTLPSANLLDVTLPSASLGDETESSRRCTSSTAPGSSRSALIRRSASLAISNRSGAKCVIEIAFLRKWNPWMDSGFTCLPPMLSNCKCPPEMLP